MARFPPPAPPYSQPAIRHSSNPSARPYNPLVPSRNAQTPPFAPWGMPREHGSCVPQAQASPSPHPLAVAPHLPLHTLCV
eukprot:scaffold7366_cov53-Isochrysis_galbana.AAC.1